MYIHHGAVGAIIGNRGANIHMIKQLSQAQVTVDTQSDHQVGHFYPSNHPFNSSLPFNQYHI